MKTYAGKQALIVAGGRPPHVGHGDIVKQIEEAGFDKLVWVVGEYGNKVSFRSPFVGVEREEMVKAMLKERTIESVVCGVADINDPPNYANHVIDTLALSGIEVNEENTVVVSGNGYTYDCFTNYGREFEHMEQQRRVDISGTQVRQMIALDLPWRYFVSKGVQEIIDDLDGVSRIKELHELVESSKHGGYQNPLPAVDIIVADEVDNSPAIWMGYRKNDPVGWALFGGFIDYGETIERAGVRELGEEGSVEGYDVSQFRCYSASDRDSRVHMISHVVIAKARGEFKPNDDILEVKKFKLSDLPSNIAFDHREIIGDYAKSIGYDFFLQKS